MSNQFQKNLREYTPVKSVSRKTGREQIRYVYQGDIYTFRLDQKQYRRLRLGLPLICACQLALYFFLLLRRIPSNSSFVMAPAACGLLAMGYMDMGIFTLLTVKKDLTGWEYRSLDSRLRRGSALSLCLFLLTFFSELLFLLSFSQVFLPDEILNGFGYLILALISGSISAVWKKIPFDIQGGDSALRKKNELLDDLEHAFGKTSDFH